MKKIIIILSLFLYLNSVSMVFAGEVVNGTRSSGRTELTAKKITAQAAEKETVEESIEFLEANVTKINNPAEKRSVYIFLASLQELLSFYDDAQLSYVKAAGIAAGNGKGMPVRSNEQIVLDAVRCALNNGDYEAADRYLNSAVRKSKNETIQAYIKLYSQWSVLCRADTVDDTKEPIAVLEAYLNLDSMDIVRSSILLTLWYITGDSKYSFMIKSDYPDSIEMAVVRGEVQLLPTPFWFFVPKKSDTDFSDADMEIGDVKTSAVNKKNNNNKLEAEDKGSSVSKWQIGFFRTEGNAQGLCQELRKKGFEPYIATEKRPSGTTYYQVIVNEDSTGRIDEKLRSAGYDCCLLE